MKKGIVLGYVISSYLSPLLVWKMLGVFLDMLNFITNLLDFSKIAKPFSSLQAIDISFTS